MAAAAADRLSALPDNILHHILSFARVREAAASAVLSRRWRPLWRSTSVLNLDSLPYYYYARFTGASLDLFFRDAKAALAAFHHSGTALKRLTLSLAVEAYLPGCGIYGDTLSCVEPEHDAHVAGLLADPAAAELEELLIAGFASYGNLYSPPLASLPCAATSLRSLDLYSCNLEPLSARLNFPLLADLRLRYCSYIEGSLQAMLDAAPALTSLALVDVRNKSPEPDPSLTTQSFSLPLRVRCPTVTDLVLVTNMHTEERDESRAIGVQIDMPNLRSFRYKGSPVKLSLTSPAPGLARVVFDARTTESYFWKCESPARMLASLSNMRALKLHINLIEDMVGDGREDQDGEVFRLPTFPNLKLLDVDVYLLNGSMELAVATLLRSCPAMAELRLKLNGWYDECDDNGPTAGGSFAESMERFNSLAYMGSAHRDIVELGGVSELSDAAFTSNCDFSCLRKVTLQFKSKVVNCFQAQLARFIVENAMVLEEMNVGDGSQFWRDHLCHKVVRWRARAFQRRNLPDTAGFRVYQLPTPVVDSNK